MTLPSEKGADFDGQMVDTYFSQLPCELWLCLIKCQWLCTAFQIPLPSYNSFVVFILATDSLKALPAPC